MRIAGVVLAAAIFTSCVSKKKFIDIQSQLAASQAVVQKCSDDLLTANQNLTKLENDLANERATSSNSTKLREEQIADLRRQISDLQKARDQQIQQVEGLTVLSHTANQNIEKTLSQMEKKDSYIRLLQLAKTKADSINLVLAVNLKNSIGIDLEDNDVEVKVDKTVVMINLSDKMLYRTGSARITARANDVLGKIARIIKSRPDLEVMVEGYTDNKPIKTDCIEDNWDLSVKRSTSVVRVLQENFGVDPNRLIAAGRGEYNALATNENEDGRSINRRTRIILMPKLDQFYDLLNPDLAAK